jgi:nucleotide-binding universal stress UspA family protein
MFKRLLLAIDESPASEVAIVFASALARSSGASVHVLHVNEYLVGGRGVTLQTASDATKLVSNAMEELCAGGILSDGSVCPATYRQVPQRIVEAARQRGAGAIVLGSNRRRHLHRLFSANVRERATRLTPLPVLTAPAPLRLASVDFGQLQAQVDAELSVFGA